METPLKPASAKRGIAASRILALLSGMIDCMLLLPIIFFLYAA
jgi:hypothetical protein